MPRKKHTFLRFFFNCFLAKVFSISLDFLSRRSIFVWETIIPSSSITAIAKEPVQINWIETMEGKYWERIIHSKQEANTITININLLSTTLITIIICTQFFKRAAVVYGAKTAEARRQERFGGWSNTTLSATRSGSWTTAGSRINIGFNLLLRQFMMCHKNTSGCAVFYVFILSFPFILNINIYAIKVKNSSKEEN